MDNNEKKIMQMNEILREIFQIFATQISLEELAIKSFSVVVK